MSYEDHLNAIKQDYNKVDKNAWSMMVCDLNSWSKMRRRRPGVDTGNGRVFNPCTLSWRLLLYRGEGLNLELPKFNCKFKKNSVTYSLTKLWNSLPSHVRLSSDSSDFRSKLQDCSFLERVL